MRIHIPPFCLGDHLKLLSWLNWILLAQHALHRGRGNKCLLLKVLAALLEDPLPRSPSSSSSSSSSQQRHAKGSAMTARFARARSAMYDGETGRWWRAKYRCDVLCSTEKFITGVCVDAIIYICPAALTPYTPPAPHPSSPGQTPP